MRIGLEGTCWRSICGKTVFLSTLFHTLNYPKPGRSYHLQTTPAEGIALAGLYGKVSDTSQPWPEFVFDCIASDRTECATSFEYEIGQRRPAVVLLLLEELVELLRNEPAGHDYFQHGLRPMLGFMQRAKCPIHLVVTKWDLVRDFGEPSDADDELRLGLVIKALLQFEHIYALVHVHSGRRIVRLIPVSAVGADFVHLEANGEVVKRPDGRLRPRNVEMPLCAVLPDLFEQVEGSLDKSLRKDLDRALWKAIKGDSVAVASGIAHILSRPAGAALRLSFQATLGRDLGTEAATMFVSWLARPFGEQDDAIRKRRTTHEVQLAEIQRLRRAVLDDFTLALKRMEDALPNSRLSPGY